MAKKNAESVGAGRMVREKEDFRWEKMVNVDQTDVRVYMKASVSYEKLTFKIKPVITYVHKWGQSEEVMEAFNEGIDFCTEECLRRLDVYRGESGIGAQGDLFEQGEPSEG